MPFTAFSKSSLLVSTIPNTLSCIFGPTDIFHSSPALHLALSALYHTLKKYTVVMYSSVEIVVSFKETRGCLQYIYSNTGLQFMVTSVMYVRYMQVTYINLIYAKP